MLTIEMLPLVRAMACCPFSSRSHYTNRYWIITIWILNIKFKLNVNQSGQIFFLNVFVLLKLIGLCGKDAIDTNTHIFYVYTRLCTMCHVTTEDSQGIYTISLSVVACGLFYKHGLT